MRPLMIQGTSSGAGKTVLVAALCRILSDSGLTVAPFKSQNMSNLSYKVAGLEISRAQAVQAVAARCDIVADLNPILLKPLGNYTSMVLLNGKKFKKMHATDYYKFARTQGFRLAIKSFRHLQERYDVVVLEGAGSPAEINLQKSDIANMRIAMEVGASVLLVSDIERGGAFASIIGTLALLERKHRDLVDGIIINKFRGDLKILRPGLRKLTGITGRPVLGTIPLAKLGLPEEDSLGADARPFTWDESSIRRLDREIDKLATLVKENLNIGMLMRLVK